MLDIRYLRENFDAAEKPSPRVAVESIFPLLNNWINNVVNCLVRRKR